MSKDITTDSLQKLEEWYDIIKEWENSRESARTFCRKKNISTNLFYNWKKRVNQTFRQDINQKEEERWRRTVEEWIKSGLTAQEYCKKNHINGFGFKAWKKRLDLDHAEEKKWKVILKEWKESGKSFQQYSKEKHIGLLTLSKWRNKFYPELAKRDLSGRKKLWGIIAQEWKESGLSQKAVCKKFGITTDTFSHWQRQFNPENVKKYAESKTRKEWESIFADWKRSGLSVSDYCKQKKIKYSTFKVKQYKFFSFSEKQTYTKRTRDEWKSIIEDWDKSGLSKLEYCKSNGVRESIFYKWMKILQKSGELRFANELSTTIVPDVISPERKNYIIIYNSGKRLRDQTGRDPVLTKKWGKIVEEWRTSGLNKTAFCKDKGIVYNSFLYWARYFYPEGVKSVISEENREKWITYIKEWKDSGLTIKAYCEQNKINEAAFFVWKKKLAEHLPKNISVRKTPEEWETIVEDWEKSGLSLKHYCKREKISLSSLYKWLNKFEKKATFRKNKRVTVNQLSGRNIIRREESNDSFRIPPEIVIFKNPTTFPKQRIEIQFAQGHHLTLEGVLDMNKLTPWLVSLLKK